MARKLIGTLCATGIQGPAGPAGPQGPQGPAGQGVPVGGTTGQVLSKKSGTDYDTEWTTPSADIDYFTVQNGKLCMIYEGGQ